MIFAIRDKYNILIVIGQWAEGTEGFAERIANQSAAPGHRVRPHLVELLQKKPIIQGQWTLQAGLAGKDYQAETVPALFLEHLHQVFDVAFGACQPVGDNVLREHAARDIQHNHDVASLSLHFLPLLTPLRLHQRQHQTAYRSNETQRFAPLTDAAESRHQAWGQHDIQELC